MARSSFYHQRALAARADRLLRRRGPKTAWSDAALLEKIRGVLAASPFYGEGHRKVWARLRFEQVRTSKARVLRLMREAQLLAPSRTLPRPANLHYRRLADSWSLFDNSGATPIVIAFEKQGEAHIMEREIYNELVARYGET
jgi:hypothetical protein